MSRLGRFAHLRDEHCQVLQIPYEQGTVSMLVVLPAAADGLAELEHTLTAEKLAAWREQLVHEEVSVIVPKFTLRSSFPGLSGVLGAMGMPAPFSPTEADFSGITQDRQLFISAIVHQAFVEVNEQGTEAAAATAVVENLPTPLPTTFRADHPFLFLIIDHRTQAILFMGRVANPGEST